jgi:hypothetical protein
MLALNLVSEVGNDEKDGVLVGEEESQTLNSTSVPGKRTVCTAIPAVRSSGSSTFNFEERFSNKRPNVPRCSDLRRVDLPTPPGPQMKSFGRDTGASPSSRSFASVCRFAIAAGVTKTMRVFGLKRFASQSKEVREMFLLRALRRMSAPMGVSLFAVMLRVREGNVSRKTQKARFSWTHSSSIEDGSRRNSARTGAIASSK